MTNSTPNGKIGLRLWSDDTPLREVVEQAGLTIKHLHQKGGPVRLPNGITRASKAARHYVSTGDINIDNATEANQRVSEILRLYAEQAWRG